MPLSPITTIYRSISKSLGLPYASFTYRSLQSDHQESAKFNSTTGKGSVRESLWQAKVGWEEWSADADGADLELVK
jgi:hypothetical protein